MSFRRIRDLAGPNDSPWVASIRIGATEISEAELAVLDASTPGTVTASLGVVVDANKDIGDFRNLDATNFDAGASGTAGTVDIFPSTAAKGKIALTAADSAGDTTTTIVNASQSGARTYTIDDAGASASFVMTEGAQTINGTKTIPAIITTDIDAGASGTAGTVDVFPSTAASGKIAITAADNAGDTTTTITNASMAAARTLTMDDPGGAADFAFTDYQVSLTANTDDGAASTIGAGVQSVVMAAVTADANDWINLPAGVAGRKVRGWSVVAHELRTPTTSNATINNVDADGTQEAAIPATTYWEADCVATDTWILRAWDELGAPITAIVPD